MAFSNQSVLRTKPSALPFPPQILERFSIPLDCLTAHLLLESADASMSTILASGNHKAFELHNPGHPFFYNQLIMNFNIREEPLYESS